MTTPAESLFDGSSDGTVLDRIRERTEALLRLEGAPDSPTEWPSDLPYSLAHDLRFMLDQLDAAIKILAEAEKVVPGLITMSGRMAFDG